jgi:hypothetical protein
LVWSDGCFAQFKYAKAWYFVAPYPWLTICDQRLKGVQMCWNYFTSTHGKGQWGKCPLKMWNLQRMDKSPSTTIARCSWHCPVLWTMDRYVTMCFFLCRSL